MSMYTCHEQYYTSNYIIRLISGHYLEHVVEIKSVSCINALVILCFVNLQTTLIFLSNEINQVSLTDNSEFSIGVHFSILVSSHALVHSNIGERQASDGQGAINDLHPLLWKTGYLR